MASRSPAAAMLTRYSPSKSAASSVKKSPGPIPGTVADAPETSEVTATLLVLAAEGLPSCPRQSAQEPRAVQPPAAPWVTSDASSIGDQVTPFLASLLESTIG